MPDELLPAFDFKMPISRRVVQYVEVELREAPQMTKIVSIQQPSPLVGA
jgi:hypothetical protein